MSCRNVDSINQISDLFESHRYWGRSKAGCSDVIGYIASLLSTHYALLTHNRRFFLAVSIALSGFAFENIVDAVKYAGKDEVYLLESATYLVFIFLGGVLCNAFWKRTTYYRAHQVYFLSILLGHFESGDCLKDNYKKPMTLLAVMDHLTLTKIIFNSIRDDEIAESITCCEARDTFRKLRGLFLALWGLCLFIALYFLFGDSDGGVKYYVAAVLSVLFVMFWIWLVSDVGRSIDKKQISR